MAEHLIENIVVTSNINQQLPLQTLSISIPDTEYDSENPVLIFRFDQPKRAVLITEQGTISCTGVTSIKQGKETIHQVIETLKQHTVPIQEIPEVYIQNFVISIKLRKNLDLDTISKKLQPDQLIYMPDKNPWIEYLYDEYITFIICASGKIVCTGIHSIDHAYQSIDEFLKLIE